MSERIKVALLIVVVTVVGIGLVVGLARQQQRRCAAYFSYAHTAHDSVLVINANRECAR